MADQVVCKGCGKTTRGSRPTCYYCGTALAPPVPCTKCGRDVPHHRDVCQYCGTSVGKVAPAPADLDAPRPAELVPAPSRPAPAPVVVPRLDEDLRDPGPADRAFAWLREYQTPIDMVLLVLALPIALLAITTSVLFGTMLKITRSGR